MKKLAMLALLLPSLCFSKANINIYGFWKSSAFDIMLKNNRHLEIIIKGRSKAVIKGDGMQVKNIFTLSILLLE
jgi:hypothetical protein